MRRGLSIVEMLVTVAILTIVLGVVISYFASASELGRITQTRSEVEDKVKTVMQLITQDLQQAGSSEFVSGSLATTISLGSTVFSASNNTLKDTFTVRYVTSLRSQANACRSVAYNFDGNTLRRSDVGCASASSVQPLADQVLAVDIRYVCSNGTLLDAYPDSACPTNTNFVRSALVSVVGRSNQTSKGNPNSTYTTVSGQTVTCPTGYICFALRQEVVMPNLKND